jgi:hypothetical protein
MIQHNNGIDRRRRFVFRGNAAAVGGRIVHPDDVILESHVASSLTVAGGRSSNAARTIGDGKYVRIDSAETLAEGLFDSREQHLALTRREVTADALSTTTRVEAHVQGVHAGAAKPVLRVKLLRAVLHSKSPLASGEPSFPVIEAAIEGVDINGHILKVDVSTAVFQRHDTKSKLLHAVGDPQESADVGHHLLLRSAIHGVTVPPRGRLLQSQSTIYATIVRSIAWADPNDTYPGVTITDHIVKVPGFGKLLFGELLISDLSRRLTLLRLELGSPQQGDVAFAEVETNGVWS